MSNNKVVVLLVCKLFGANMVLGICSIMDSSCISGRILLSINPNSNICSMEKKITLVVVDFQYDFCLLGAPLYVPGSDRALWNISHLIENKKIGEVIFTADWHPANHCSFKRNGGEWNDHCVQFSKGAAIHDLLLYGCIGSGVPYRVLIKGELPSSEEYGVKVAPATARVKYDTIYSNSIGIDVDPENQIVVCGLAGDYCVLETLKNLEPIKPMVYLDGIASLDGGIKLNNYIESNNTRLFEL